MSRTAERLKLYEAVLALIEQRRTETGDELLGSAIEKVVIESQIRDLESDILEDPGAFEPWLVRRRIN
jgi:hypothetical protein